MGSKARQVIGTVLLLSPGPIDKLIGAALVISGQRKDAKERQAQARRESAQVRAQADTHVGGVRDAVTIYGETIVGGVVVDYDTQVDDDSPDLREEDKVYNAYQLIAHAYRKGGIDGPSGFYIDDNYIAYPGDWKNSSPGRQAGTGHGGQPKSTYEPRNWGFAFPDGGAAVSMRFSSGGRASGPSGFISKFARWTAASKGTDIVWSEWQYKLSGGAAERNTKALFNNGPPKIRSVLKGNKVYDPRKDSTRTMAADGFVGSGTHRANDRDTWEWSDNPVLILVDYAYEYSDLKFRKGDTRLLNRLSWKNVADMANHCDFMVPVPGGTEKRYRCDIVVDIGKKASHRQNMKAILSSFGGTFSRVGDIFRIGVQETIASEVTLAEDDVAAGYQLRAGTGRQSRINTASGKYYDRDKDWILLDSPARKDAQAIARDGAVQAELPGSGVTRHTQMQRLCELAIRDVQQQETFLGEASMKALQLTPGTGVTLDLPEFAAPKLYRVDGVTLLRNGANPISFTATEYLSSVHADMAAADYHAIDAEGAFDYASGKPFSPTAFKATGIAGGIRWEWTNPGIFDEVELYTSTNADWTNADRKIVFAGKSSFFIEEVPAGTTKHGWIRAVGSNGLESLRTPNDDISSVSATSKELPAIYGSLPAGRNCPAVANDDKTGQIFIDTATGKAFRRGPIPWQAEIPSTIDENGVDGILVNDKPPVFSASSSRYRWSWHGNPAGDYSRVPDGVLATPPGYLIEFACYPNPPANFQLHLNNDPRYVSATREDLKADIETDLLVVVRHNPTGSTLQTMLANDTSEPYTWPPAGAVVSGTVSTIAEFVALGTASTDTSDWTLVLLRPSLRCEDDALNAWIPFALGTTAQDGLGIEYIHALRATDSAIPSSDLPADTLAYDAARNVAGDDVGVLVGSTRWFDSPQQTTAALPWQATMLRYVPGQPKRGDLPQDNWGAWAGPTFEKLYAADGSDGREFQGEEIWAASTEESLSAAQHPLNAWTLGQVAAAGTAGITRGGVEWNARLQDSGFSLEKEYGWRARREHPSTQTSGAVSALWDMQLFSHWAGDPEGGLVTRREYNSFANTSSLIADTSGSGRYQFRNDAGVVQSTWAGIVAATSVTLDRLDRNGWPVLVLDELTTFERLVFEPASSQWASYDILAITHKPETSLRKTQTILTLAPVTKDGHTGGSTPGTDQIVDFYFEKLEPQKPRIGGTAVYSASSRLAESTTIRLRPSGTNRLDGYFDFYNSDTVFSATTDLPDFPSVIKTAKVLRLSHNDEHGNRFTSLDRLAAGEHVVAELRINNRNWWAAWRVVSIQDETLPALTGNIVATKFEGKRIQIELVAYDIARYGIPANITYESNQDVVLGVTPNEPYRGALGIRLAEIIDQASGVTSLPYSAELWGSALNSVGVGRFVGRAVVVVDGTRYEEGGTGTFRITKPVFSADNTSCSGTITLAAKTADSRIVVQVQAWAPSLPNVPVVADDEFFQLDGTGGTRTPTLTVSINSVADVDEGTGPVALGAVVGGTATGPITYNWRATKGTISSATAASPTWTPPADVTPSEVVTITLTVTRGGLTPKSDMESVTVRDVTRLTQTLLVSINPVDDLDEGSSGVTLGANVTGTATGSILYEWTASNGTLSDANAAAPTWTPPSDVRGDLTVTLSLSVTRGGLTASDRELVVVKNVVTLSATIVGPRRMTVPNTYRFSVNVGGSATGTITYNWSLRGAGLVGESTYTDAAIDVTPVASSGSITCVVTRGGTSVTAYQRFT